MLLHSRFTMPQAPIYALCWRETKQTKVPCVRKQPSYKVWWTEPSCPKTDVLTSWPPCLHISWQVLTLCNDLINYWGNDVVIVELLVLHIHKLKGTIGTCITRLEILYCFFYNQSQKQNFLSPGYDLAILGDRKNLKITVKDRSLSSHISYSTVGRK